MSLTKLIDYLKITSFRDLMKKRDTAKIAESKII